MTERLNSQELIDPYNKAHEFVGRHLLDSGHRLSSQELNWLITAVTSADLSNHPLAEKFSRTPIAKIRGPELTLDSQFDNFDLNQQVHVLLHEYSHRLDTFLEHQNDERYQEILARVSQLPANQVSYYSNFLTEKFRDNEQKTGLLQRERTAEVLAQYLESDRTFSGFIQAKLLEFPQGDQDLSEEERGQFQLLQAQVGELGEYLSIADSEEEYEDFLAHHSDLLPHYQLWKELDGFFAEADFSQLEAWSSSNAPEEDAELEDMEEIWEEMELAQYVHPPAPSSSLTNRTVFQPTEAPEATQPTPFSDLVTFWRIFG
jgi:hypothetical protein